MTEDILDDPEFKELVLAVDLTNPIMLQRFQFWKKFDGSKEGLKLLVKAQQTVLEELASCLEKRKDKV
jgi:hypothetical protein